METVAEGLAFTIIILYLAAGFDGMLRDLGLYHFGEDERLHWGPGK